MREKLQQIPGDLGARLRALRSRYPTLAINTEIIHHTDRLIAFRATIASDGLVRAQGHAAQRAEPTGAFVTVAETLAVEQALLLGGFDLPEDAIPVEAGLGQGESLPDQGSPTIERTLADESPAPEGERTPVTATTTLDAGQLVAPTSADTNAAPSAPITSTVPEASTASAESVPPAAEATPPPAPRPKRDRQAERARAKARAAGTAIANATESEQSSLFVPADASPHPEDTASADTHAEVAEPTTAPETTPTATQTTDEVVSIHPAPAPLSVEEPAEAPARETAGAHMAPIPPTAPRRSRTRSAATVPAAPVTTDAPPTREALREAWQVGRPIPAWWPQDRPLVAQPIGKTRVSRLRALALDEEISPALLDTYSTLLFGVTVAALDQTQSMILEERLNPAYPSPLEELRVRRILHPLAVSDAMTIPEDRPFFIHWSDVPPVEEAPEPTAPPTISWRERGKKGGGRRR